jgi:hypothetical protein
MDGPEDSYSESSLHNDSAKFNGKQPQESVKEREVQTVRTIMGDLDYRFPCPFCVQGFLVGLENPYGRVFFFPLGFDTILSGTEFKCDYPKCERQLRHHGGRYWTIRITSEEREEYRRTGKITNLE